MSDQDQSREIAVARLQAARQLRDKPTNELRAGRGSPSELAAYAKLQTAVDQFAAREASLAWLDSR